MQARVGVMYIITIDALHMHYFKTKGLQYGINAAHTWLALHRTPEHATKNELPTAVAIRNDVPTACVSMVHIACTDIRFMTASSAKPDNAARRINPITRRLTARVCR